MKKIPKVLIVVFAFALLYLPIIVIGILSFNSSQVGSNFGTITARWYTEIFANSSLSGAIVNTLIVAFVSTIISTIAGTLIAIGIYSFRNSSRNRLLLLNNFPVVNADISTAITLMIIFSLLGLRFGFTTMLLSHIFFSIPFVILSVAPRLRELDKDLLDAAIDLGCNKFQALYKVLIPSIRTGIITGGLIAFTMSIDDFVISWFNTGNGFDNFSIWIYARLGRKTFSPSAYAYNSLVTIITIAGLVIYNLKTVRRLKK